MLTPIRLPASGRFNLSGATAPFERASIELLGTDCHLQIGARHLDKGPCPWTRGDDVFIVGPPNQVVEVRIKQVDAATCNTLFAAQEWRLQQRGTDPVVPW